MHPIVPNDPCYEIRRKGTCPRGTRPAEGVRRVWRRLGRGSRGVSRRGPELGRLGVVLRVRAAPTSRLRASLPIGLRAFLLGDLRWLFGRGQVEPDRGAGRVPEISPLSGEVLDQEQAVSLGRVQITLHDGGACGAVVDDLDEDTARDSDYDDRHGAT